LTAGLEEVLGKEGHDESQDNQNDDDLHQGKALLFSKGGP
jgi:hypothetical protein